MDESLSKNDSYNKSEQTSKSGESTGCKRFEEALRISEEKFTKLFHNSPAAATLTRLSDGAILDVNDSALSLLRFTREEVIGKKTVDLKIWVSSQERNRFVEDLSSKGSVHNRELTLRKKDGEYLYVNISAAVIVINGEQDFISSFFDVTEQKKAKDSILSAKERLQSILNGVDDGITLTGLDGRVVDCNEASLRLTGLSHEEFIGLNVYDIIVPEDKQRAIEGAVKVLETGKIVNQVRVLRKNSTPFFAEISVNAIYDKDKKPVGFLGVTRDITERKKMETELKESEELYRTLFDNSDDGFMLIEPLYDERGNPSDIRFLKFNAAYERQTGTKAADAIGKKASEIVPDLEPRIVSSSIEVAKSQKPTHLEVFDKYSRKWYDSYYIPFAKGQVGILFRDITERKKAEQGLKEKDDELNCILDSSPTIIFYKDKQGKVIQANKAFAEALKVSKEDLLGKTVFDLYSFEIAQKMTNDDLVVMKSKKPKIGTIEPYNSPTGLRWIRTDKIPSFDQKGEVDGIIGFSEEITERKIAEEALRESQTKYQALIETTSDFIWEIDSTGKYTYCSPQIEKLFGVKASVMIGKTPFDMIPESEKKEGAKIFSKIVASAQPFFGLQTTACDAKGRLIFIETNGVPFFDGKGKLSGFRGISRDVTERKAFEKQLQDKERLAVIGATAGMVGHDIRNPLQALASEVYMLKSDLADLPQNETKESVNESIVSLEKNIAYINKIVSDLQDYAKKLVPEKKCVDLSEVIVRVFGIIDIPENIEVSFGVKGLPSIRTDPEFVQRALTNLVNNAVQAMPGGGKLEITGIKTEGKICLIVSDTGVGIPEEIKSKLFTPMMTTKSKGQGFGLAATKRLIEALGGSITFESEAGKGTKFIIELPFTQ